jgi:molecular chaperone DnaK
LFEVLSTSGDTYLGGEDFDKRITDWLIEGFQKETGIDLREDRMALQRLKEASEKAKCELSMSEETRITLPFISADASGPKHLNRILTRVELEGMVDDLIQRTIDPVNDAMKAAGVSASQIDQVVLVGGQTRMPKVVEAVKKAFGKDPNRNINPDEVVAVGAAIQGGILRGALPRYRDARRTDDETDREKFDDSDEKLAHFHHGRGQPEQGADPRAAG